MTPIILIKEVEPSDLEALANGYCKAFLKYQPDDLTEEESNTKMKEYFLGTLQKQLEMHSSVQECMIDNDTNEYLAYFSAYERDDSDTGDKYVHIPEIFVNPDYQKMGYGKQIMKDGMLLCSARFENSEWIDLNTQPYNKPALALYTKLGFKIMFIIGIILLILTLVYKRHRLFSYYYILRKVYPRNLKYIADILPLSYYKIIGYK